MLPIGDDNSGRRTFPIVTYTLIALNVLFFFVEMSGGDAFVKEWAFRSEPVPGESVGRCADALHVDVHARRVAAPRRQHALPVDLR